MNTAPTTPPESRAPRHLTSPIVWGAFFLAFCAWITQRTFFPDAVTSTMWVTFTAIGLGVLLLGIGIMVALRGRPRP